MRLTAKLIIAIWIAVAAVGVAFSALQADTERQRILDELERQAAANCQSLAASMPADPFVPLDALLKERVRPGQIVEMYDRDGRRTAVCPATASAPALEPQVARAIASGAVNRALFEDSAPASFAYIVPLVRGDAPAGALAMVLDASALRSTNVDHWNRSLLRIAILATVVSVVTFVIVRTGVTGPIARLAEWAHALHSGKTEPPPLISDSTLFGPLTQQVSKFADSLSRARAAAENEAALRVRGDTIWTEERLKQFVQLRLSGPLFVVSNREPVIHVRKGRRVVAETPASGLVTALEPVLRACGGVWVAHGSGDADREVVDTSNRVGVPPDHPRYMLRRVWLTTAEEEGYYYGFANEGLWPLCHIAHTRPLFRPTDWEFYRSVNQKFAAAVIEEIRDVASPLVLIQDYHFALLPELVKRARPDARVAIFWHIPWPNSEAFGICPQQNELLSGMLGADLVGFHTQYHCNNFLETVERAIEARVDWERFAVVRGEHTTLVKPFPISVAPPEADDAPRTTRAAVLESLGIEAEFFGVGVERVDYTKGLPERIRSLGRLFDLHPEYRGRLVFVQIGAPSRSRIPRYQQLEAEVQTAVSEVNERLQNGKWRPVHYLNRHHDHREILPIYRAADFCMVTSLHDGMNLVAKEFAAARDDEDGVLVLSRFTGAADELRDALLVNPYDLDGMANAIHEAVTMPREERQRRMARMRRAILEHNVFRWAGALLGDLSRVAEQPPKTAAAASGAAPLDRIEEPGVESSKAPPTDGRAPVEVPRNGEA